jgi:hypothetical protein
MIKIKEAFTAYEELYNKYKRPFRLKYWMRAVRVIENYYRYKLRPYTPHRKYRVRLKKSGINVNVWVVIFAIYLRMAGYYKKDKPILDRYAILYR